MLTQKVDSVLQGVARGDRQGLLRIRGIPAFENPHDKRIWIRQHMAAAFRFFGKNGYTEGTSGHVSVRGMLPGAFCWELFLDIDELTLEPHRSNITQPFLDEPLRCTLQSAQGIRHGSGRC